MPPTKNETEPAILILSTRAEENVPMLVNFRGFFDYFVTKFMDEFV